MSKYILTALLACALAACGGSTAYVTTIGPDMLPGATGVCSMDANVLIAGSYDAYRAVSIGDGYAVTAAAAVDGKKAVTVSYERAGQTGFANGTAKVVVVDRGADLALLRLNDQPGCDAVLADMSRVKGGDDVRIPAADGLHRGNIVMVRPVGLEVGDLNSFMRLSWSMKDVPIGSGIYDDAGRLVGLRTASGEGSKLVVALPADRIARFLEAHRVSYTTFDPTGDTKGFVFTAIN